MTWPLPLILGCLSKVKNATLLLEFSPIPGPITLTSASITAPLVAALGIFGGVVLFQGLEVRIPYSTLPTFFSFREVRVAAK